MKKNVLIIIEGLYPPLTEVSGVKIIYKYLIEIARNYNLHILTTISRKTIKNWKKWAHKQRTNNMYFHFINTVKYDFHPLVRLSISKIPIYFKAQKIIKKYNISLIHEFSSVPALSIITQNYSRKFNIPVIYTISTVNNSVLGNLKYTFGIKELTLLTISGKTKYQKAQQIFPKYKNKIHFTPFGCENIKSNYKKSFLLKKYNLPNNKKILTYIGPLEKRKGIHILLEALRNISNKFCLLVVTYGKGGLDDKFAKNLQKTKNKLENIEYKIIVGKENIADVFKVTDLFILPSISLQGTLAQPLTLIEALYCKKNIIASDLKENREILKNYRGVKMFKNKNPNDLNRCINQVLSKKFEKFSGNTESLLIDNQVNKIIKLYKKIL
jgi:glycosyltransferase involved in cell wall biosynthesis